MLVDCDPSFSCCCGAAALATGRAYGLVGGMVDCWLIINDDCAASCVMVMEFNFNMLRIL